MPGWRDEYLASIREQEKNNPVNLELVDLCELPQRDASSLNLSEMRPADGR